MHSLLILITVLATTALPINRNSIPSAEQLKAWTEMAKIAHDVCPTVPLTGNTLRGGASLGAEGSIPSLIAKLIQVKISAAIRGDGARWEGLLQNDLEKANSDSLSCSQAVYAHMFDAFYLSDMATLKPINRPSNPAVTYRARIASIRPSNLPTIKNFIANAPNSVSAETINGNVMFEATKEHRAKYLAMLQEIYVRGNAILWGAVVNRPTDDSVKILTKDFIEWVNKSGTQINDAMTPAALSSFINVKPPDAGASVVYTPPLSPPLSPDMQRNITVIWYTLPEYLTNIKYLMEHDTMDPQNAGN